MSIGSMLLEMGLSVGRLSICLPLAGLLLSFARADLGTLLYYSHGIRGH